MPEYIKLKDSHLNLLIDCFQLVVDFKHKTLSKSNWIEFEANHLPKVISYFQQNQFKVVTSHEGIFPWMIDQICHSRRLVPGIKPKECIPLADTPIGEETLAICRAAKNGQHSYQVWCHSNQFHNLFS
jgi:hypothetical protein